MTCLFFQEWTGEGDRINEEPGGLSAAGELAVSEEVKAEKIEDTCEDPQPLQVLREQLRELGINTTSSSDNRADHAALRQREGRLIKVIPLYIQVWVRMHLYASFIYQYFSFIELKKD